jgi:hypothetical protein
MLFSSSCAQAWTMMTASAGYLSSLVPDRSAHQPGANALAQPKEQQAFGIWNDYENNNNTHPPEFFTIIDPFWLDVVVVAANNEPSGTHHGAAKSIDLTSMMSANGTGTTMTASELFIIHDAARSCCCHCDCHDEEPTTTSSSTTTVELAKRLLFDQAME